jgi:hypothetical protein
MNYNETEIPRSYKYKIQWLFAVAPDLFEKHKQEIKNLYAVIRALGANSFDRINLKDSEGKVIGWYKDETISVNQKKLDAKAIRCLTRELKKNTNIYYVELIRS